MSFEIVELPAGFVAGLTIPLAGREVTRRDLDLVNFTWDRYLDRERGGVRVAAYIGQMGRSAAVLGYECASPAEADAGDVITRVPAGSYAKFSVTGKPYDLTRTVWAEIAKADEAGELNRAYTADIERFVDATSVEVYISITQ